MGYDGIKIVEELGYVVSSIRQPVDLMAKKSAEIIISLINKQAVPKINYLPVHFVDVCITFFLKHQQGEF